MGNKNRISILVGVGGICIAGLIIARRKTDPTFRDDADAGQSALRRAGKSAVIEPLSPVILGQRFGDVYRDGYLTVLAIIQGVAFGLLLSSTHDQWISHHSMTYHIKIALQGAAVLVAIVIVTHRYILLTMIGRWVPTTFDTMIPYGLGVGETGAALVLGTNAAWWTCIAFFSIIAIASYVNSRIRMDLESFGELVEIHARFLRISAIAIASMSGLLIVSIVLAILSVLKPDFVWLYSTAPVLFIAATVAIELSGGYPT